MTPLNEKVFLTWEEAFNIPSKFIGGKAMNISRLVNYGFKVPIGGVLSSYAYDRFLSENNLHKTIHDLKASINIETYMHYEEELYSIRNKILAGSFPASVKNEIASILEHSNILNKPLAIRSSITCEDSKDASFAGIFESFLNITGIDNILDNIKKCYASIWTIKSISYLIKMNLLDEEIKGSVILMEMVNAESAGVAFSCDPQIGNSNTLVINANYGLGESVVGGVIEPDEYRLCYKYSRLRISQKKIGKKQGVYIPAKDGGTTFIHLNSTSNRYGYNFKSQNQVLDDSAIIELALIVLRVHEILGGEEFQDIEWAYDGESFFLVQVRPVTVYANYTYSSLKHQPQIWSNANFKEVMPEVHSHLSWNIIKDILETMLIAPLSACNYRFGEDIMRARLHNGRPYLNLSVLQWETFDAFGISPQQYNERIGGHQPEIKITLEQASSKLIRKNIRQIYCFLHMLSNNMKSKKIFDSVIKNCSNLKKLNLSKLSSGELIQTFYKANNIALKYAPTAQLYNMSAALSIGLLQSSLCSLFQNEGIVYTNKLLQGNSNIISADQGHELVKLSNLAKADTAALNFLSSGVFDKRNWKEALPDDSVFKKAFNKFLEYFGHRGVCELDIKNPRWIEDPTYLFNYIGSIIDSNILLNDKSKNKEGNDNEIWRKVKNKTSLINYFYIKLLAKKSVSDSRTRELSKSVLVHILYPLRLIFLEIGNRLFKQNIINEPDDIFFCSWVEIFSILQDRWNGNSLKVLITDRKEKADYNKTLEVHNVIFDNTPLDTANSTIKQGKVLNGLPVASGLGEGKVKLLYNPMDGIDMAVGSILVAPTTDPAWTPLFLKASAIIVETGGYLSHGAIVAREYGIPAVANISNIMNILHDGQSVIVDGNSGKVILKDSV